MHRKMLQRLHVICRFMGFREQNEVLQGDEQIKSCPKAKLITTLHKRQSNKRSMWKARFHISMESVTFHAYDVLWQRNLSIIMSYNHRFRHPTLGKSTLKPKPKGRMPVKNGERSRQITERKNHCCRMSILYWTWISTIEHAIEQLKPVVRGCFALKFESSRYQKPIVSFHFAHSLD